MLLCLYYITLLMKTKSFIIFIIVSENEHIFLLSLQYYNLHSVFDLKRMWFCAKKKKKNKFEREEQNSFTCIRFWENRACKSSYSWTGQKRMINRRLFYILQRCGTTLKLLENKLWICFRRKLHFCLTDLQARFSPKAKRLTKKILLRTFHLFLHVE